MHAHTCDGPCYEEHAADHASRKRSFPSPRMQRECCSGELVACAQIEFFKGIDLDKGASGIVFTCTPEGRPKGEAYVEFGSEEAQKEALKRHKNEMGERYIELFLSTKANMLQASRAPGPAAGV